MGGFTSNSKEWLASESRILKRTERTIGQVIVNRTTMIVPVLSGDLSETGRIEDNPTGGISVVYGGNGVAYGRIQELGGVTGRNYQTKIVGKHYLKRGGDSVAKEPLKKYVDMNR